MASNWSEAQKNEKLFWDKIYVSKNMDIISHTPISLDKAVDFAETALLRFDMDMSFLSKNITCADIGCGPYGLMVGFDNYLKKTKGSSHLIGLDPLYDTYKGYNTLPVSSNYKYYAAKAENIPVEDNSTDYVFSINVIDHVDNPKLVVEECLRIAKNSSYFLLSVHVVRTLFEPIRPVLYKIDKNHPHHFSKKDILNMLTDNDFVESISVTYEASVQEDHPDFNFYNIFKSKNIMTGVKRWVSTFLLKTVYIKVKKTSI